MTTRGKHWQKGELAAIARELRLRVNEAYAAGRPPIVNWPVDRELRPGTRRLYATLGVLIRFVDSDSVRPGGQASRREGRS